ncbi:hypothetical protein AVEN_177979-1 [Araneus ventricosus]|uniref:Gustatory receptor n=1 Tax=Araneus ventricosus TaxID=182803 RepID=A0A4Y2EHY3_ARAVE|nr:hypothetical protein AVEN_177979-1 [Araneus ventricosus]
MMVGLLSYDEAKRYEYITMFGVVLGISPHFVSFIIHCIYNFYLLTLPLLVCLLYVYICFYIKIILSHLTDVLKRCDCLPNVSVVFDYALKVFFVIEKAEEALSVCIFFVVALNLGLSFTSFAYSLGYYDVSTSASSGVVCWFFSSQASFILIVWTASNVKKESQTLKKTFQLVLSDMKISQSTATLFLQKIAIFDSVSLTGWKMFEFSKGLILTAAGTILTYGLLVLQTENYTSKRTPHLLKKIS